MTSTQQNSRSTDDGSDASQPLVFDRVGMMSRIDDDHDLGRLIADSFLEHVPGQVTALRAFLEGGDLVGAAQMAHKVRGAAAAVGGNAFCAVSLSMEMSAKAGDTTAASALLAGLELQLAQLQKALATEL